MNRSPSPLPACAVCGRPAAWECTCQVAEREFTWLACDEEGHQLPTAAQLGGERTSVTTIVALPKRN